MGLALRHTSAKVGLESMSVYCMYLRSVLLGTGGELSNYAVCGSGIFAKPNPDSGVRLKKAPDPGSATLYLRYVHSGAFSQVLPFTKGKIK